MNVKHPLFLFWELIIKPRPLAVIRNRRLNSVALLAPLRSVQFSSVLTRFLLVEMKEHAPKVR